MFVKTRARKKKGLKSRINILPFPGQSLRKKADSGQQTPKENQPSVPVERPVQPEIRTLSQPTKTVVQPLVTVKELKEKFSVKEQPLNENLPKEEFTKDQLNVKWQMFAHKIGLSGLTTFQQCMMKRPPILEEDFHIKFVLDNKVIVDMIQPDLNQLIDYLRKELKNHSINVELTIEEVGNSEIPSRPITGKDKFTLLAKRNPNLYSLKNILNLDIEP